MIASYYQNEEFAKDAAGIFNTNHPDRIIGHQCSSWINLEFQISNRKHKVFRPVSNEAVKVAVLVHDETDNQSKE